MFDGGKCICADSRVQASVQSIDSIEQQVINMIETESKLCNPR